VLRSEDLVHWKIVGHVLPKLEFGADYDMVPPFTLTDAGSKPVGPGLKYGEGVWAPAIRYHSGRFYVFWPTPKEGIFMASAATPEGPWTAPVSVISGPGYEDPCPFWDDDGQAYLVHGKVGAGPLILHRMSVDGTHVLDEGKVIVNDPQNLPTLEGPKLYKRNGWYYIFAPFGGVGEGSQVVLRAKNIYGPYDWKIVLSKGDTAVQGPHQGGYVETPSGQGWFLHFNQTGAFGRIDYLEPVSWQGDWPVMGEDGHPVATYAMPDTGTQTHDRLQDSDEFASPKLGLQWAWNHNPDDRLWSLTERPGYLRLRAGPAEHLVTARNTLTQILQGPHEIFTTRIDLSHMVEGQRAGLTLFGVKPVWIGAVDEAGSTHIAFASAGVETAGPTAGKTIVLRAEVTADTATASALRLLANRRRWPNSHGGRGPGRACSPLAKGNRAALSTSTGSMSGIWRNRCFAVNSLSAPPRPWRRRPLPAATRRLSIRRPIPPGRRPTTRRWRSLTPTSRSCRAMTNRS